MTDIVSLLVGGGVGAAAAVAVSYFVFYARPGSEGVKTLVRGPDGALAKATVSQADLERSKREMRASVLERDLLSSALMKVYEAETDGRITKEEREMIAKKYADQIKEMQSKLKDVELVVEVGELEALREELVTMFQEKIQNLEARLDQARERLGAVAPTSAAAPAQARKEQGPRTDKPQELEKVVEKKAKPEMSESEKRVKEIRNEVMEALTRLERIDVEKKQQET